jgi:hypothetical protein
MKYLLTVLMVFALITIGCKKNATESNNTGEIMEHSTVNVKTATEYFRFANNSGSTNETATHDIVFYAIQWVPAPGAPTIWDPRFKAKDGISIAVLKDTKLEDVTEVPANGEFVTNYSTETDIWYYTTDAHIVLSYENVWVVNTADGRFPAFVVTNYYDEQGESGVFGIEWKYLSD